VPYSYHNNHNNHNHYNHYNYYNLTTITTITTFTFFPLFLHAIISPFQMISFNGLSVMFGGQYLFRDISFLVNPKDKIGLVGRNGAGKSTLLKILMGQQSYDEGQVVTPPGVRLGYLPQQMVVTDNKTLFEEAASAFEEINTLEKEIVELTRIIESATDTDSDEYLDDLGQLAEKSERFHLLDDGDRDQKIEEVITGLGFKRRDFSRPTREFSGGWRMRIEMAKILLRSPDVFLLDEPTNHLDIDSIQWLEEFLKNYHGAVVLISHDRAFLDTVTVRTVEISLDDCMITVCLIQNM